MIYTLNGRLTEQGENYFILETGGFGLKVWAGSQTLATLPPAGSLVKVFCFLYIREEHFELYGFLREEELKLFEMLNTVAGIGPKTALAILSTDSVENIMAAILERKSELLTRISGIGQRTADRVILELQNKIKLPKSKSLTKIMDINLEVEEALVGLGYRRSEIKKALSRLPVEAKNLEDRIRQTLRILAQR